MKIIISLLIFVFFIQCSSKPKSNKKDNEKKVATEKNLSQPKSGRIIKAGASDVKKVISIQDSLFKVVKSSDDTLLLMGLMKKAADVNYIDKDGNYPLLVAKRRTDSVGKALMVNKLIELGALDINSLVSQFFKYCENGNLDSIQKMLYKGYDINWKERYYEETEEGGGCGCMCEKTALFIAAKNQNIELVKYFIKNGAQVYLDEGALQPLEPAIISKNWGLAKLLLENGANKDVSKCYWWGWNGLSQGSSYYHKLQYQDTVTLNFLLQNNFSYPIPKYINWVSTPIDNAASKSDTLILKRLIPLTNNKKELDKALCFSKNIDVSRILINNGAKPTYIYSWAGEGNSGEVISPLYRAIYEGNTELIELYLSNGADVNILYDRYNGKKSPMPSYYTIGYPLLIAAEKGNVEIVKLLLEKGAKVNFAVSRQYYNDDRKDLSDDSKSEFWQSPLIAAVFRNDSSMVELFLKNGANVVVNGDTITNYKFRKEIDSNILKMLNENLKKR